jgi:hypothetical protein
MPTAGPNGGSSGPLTLGVAAMRFSEVALWLTFGKSCAPCPFLTGIDVLEELIDVRHKRGVRPNYLGVGLLLDSVMLKLQAASAWSQRS